MASNDGAEILLVDDEPDELRPLAVLVENAGNRCRVLSPGDVSEADLKSADLILVDLTLDDDWLRGVASGPLGCRPPNGIALASVFRQYADQYRAEPPTGFALITGQTEFFSQLPSERRPHVISRLSNFEWFFEKQNATRNAQQIAELAKAIRCLPANVKKELGDAAGLLRFLKVPADHPWIDRYQDSVMRCRPPLHHLSERSHGLIIIRWLLHRILPHTCFLFDKWNLAARLRVTPDSLEKCLIENQRIADEVAAVKYTGPLAGFDGPRWWRSGVEQWLWNKTEGESASGEAIHPYLSSLGSPALVPVNLALPVVTVDKDLRPTRTFSNFSDTKALRLDDWPDYAEPAYVTNETLEQNPEMRAYVSDLA